VIADRYERKSVLVTSNLAFGDWPKVFGGDENLTTALLDRLAHHATVIATKGKSFRMRRRSEAKPDRSEEPTSNKPRKQAKA
jgi:DNA replication protein DnaC